MSFAGRHTPPLKKVRNPSSSSTGKLLADSHTVIEYYETIENRRVVSDVTPGYLQHLLPSGPPQEGEEWSEIQKDIESKIMPGLTHWYAGRVIRQPTLVKVPDQADEDKAIP